MFVFTNKEDVENYYKGDKIQCLICKKWFKSLGRHLPTHKMNVDKYKKEFGLPWGKGLCGCITADKHRNNAETRRANGELLTGCMSKEHAAKLHKTGSRKITPLHSKDRSKFFTNLGKQNKYHILDYQKCWKLFNDGLTQKEIGKMFGVSQMTVSRFMRVANKHQERA